MKDKLISGGITTGTGVIGLLDRFSVTPEDISVVACLAGILGTFVIIIVTVIKSRYDAKISELTIKKLKKEIGAKND